MNKGGAGMAFNEAWPVGYRVQTGIPCCANCKFGGYLGGADEVDRLCICEVMGAVDGSQYFEVAKEPLGICDAWKPRT